MIHTFSKIILVLAIIIVPFYADAQRSAISNGTNYHLYPAHVSGMRAYNANQQKQSTAKTTSATGSRLISIAHMTYDGSSYMPMDSATYNYSGTRGGYYGISGWEWLYDSVHSYSYTSGAYQNYLKDVQTFDINNNVTLFVDQWWDVTTPIPYWRNEINTIYLYDAMNNPVIIKSQSWNPTTSTWDSTYRYTNTYDGANNLLTNTREIWDASSSAWVNEFRYTYTYDGANNLLTELEEQWNNTSWENHNKTVYTYDAANNRITELLQYWGAGSWANNYYVSNYNFVNHQPQTKIDQAWNWSSSVFVNTTKENYTYNSYSQPTYNYVQHWNPDSSTWSAISGDYAYRYYYETYITGTQNLNNSIAGISVYPVPAKDEVFIDITWTKPQAFTVAMMDIQGRMYTSYHVLACAQYRDKMTLNNIPAGNYIVKISGTSGEIIKKVTIVK